MRARRVGPYSSFAPPLMPRPHCGRLSTKTGLPGMHCPGPGLSGAKRGAGSGLPGVLCAAPGDKMAARGRRAEPPGREAPGPAGGGGGGGGSRWAESGPGTSPESGDDEVSGAGSSPVSGGVNLFANDGSFLELFKRKMEEEQRQRQEEPPPGPQRPDQPATAAAAGPGDPKRKGGPGPTLSFVRSRGGGGGRQGLPWPGESGPRKGIGIQVHPLTPIRGPSGSPAEDSEPGFPTREVWGRRWGPQESARRNWELGGRGIPLETAFRGSGDQGTRIPV